MPTLGPSKQLAWPLNSALGLHKLFQITFNKCVTCEKPINRYNLDTLKNILKLQGGFYTHHCANCGTTYAPSILVLAAILILLTYIELDVIFSSLYTTLLIIIPTIIILVAYVLPLSPFTKPKYFNKT